MNTLKIEPYSVYLKIHPGDYLYSFEIASFIFTFTNLQVLILCYSTEVYYSIHARHTYIILHVQTPKSQGSFSIDFINKYSTNAVLFAFKIKTFVGVVFII